MCYTKGTYVDNQCSKFKENRLIRKKHVVKQKKEKKRNSLIRNRLKEHLLISNGIAVVTYVDKQLPS